MDRETWEKKLHEEGFSEVNTHTEGPNFYFEEHEHPVYTSQVILEGLMIIWQEGKQHDLKPGDRFDVPKGMMHSAKIGPEGCTYIIGIRI